MPGEEQDRSGGDPDSPTKPGDADEAAEDTEGQALTWKVRKPIPEAAEDVEGHSVRPPPDQIGLTNPAISDESEDDTGSQSFHR